ncbi:gem-associated protein 6 [Synchiropus splendidus]|uniref:gem-associated protein 6 n=1 Tax=Synchiropus splendidus TaxID=270530 RepID=UPI00237E041A|nr:gem-associated protein 6 [Synchiropus splendidus]
MQDGWTQLGPLKWNRYVNRHVTVRTVKDDGLRGWLVTVDPVTSSLVLVNFEEGCGPHVQVVMGHAVQQVEVLQEADPEMSARLQSLFRPPEVTGLDPEERRRRCEQVRSWLEANRIPVEEEGEELRVAGVLTLVAPYRPEDCRSTNQIILDRVQRLLQNTSHS